MASATFAEATAPLRKGRPAWDRDAILIAIQEWVATYGEPPRAADWNPSAAKWAGQLWRVDRYRAGRADGTPWPALNSAKRPFGGSLNAAVTAAGFAPARPGPPRRRTDVELPELAAPTGDEAALAAALARTRAELAAERRAGAELAARLERAQATGGPVGGAVAARTGRLNAAERAALHAAGPAGPAVLADALRALKLARASGNPARLRDALDAVARAAVGWGERI